MSWVELVWVTFTLGALVIWCYWLTSKNAYCRFLGHDYRRTTAWKRVYICRVCGHTEGQEQ